MSNSGRFSRRHQTAKAHLHAQSVKAARVTAQAVAATQREAARAARSNREQIAELDATLGVGQGARKERARLEK